MELMASVGSYVEVDRDDEAGVGAKECVELKKLLDLKGSSCTTATRCTGSATMADVSVQTDSDLCNTVVVSGEASLVEVVAECAFLQVLSELNYFKASWEESLACYDFSVASLASTAGGGDIWCNIDFEESNYEAGYGFSVAGMASTAGGGDIWCNIDFEESNCEAGYDFSVDGMASTAGDGDIMCNIGFEDTDFSQHLLYIIDIQEELIRQFRRVGDDMDREVASGCVG